MEIEQNHAEVGNGIQKNRKHGEAQMHLKINDVGKYFEYHGQNMQQSIAVVKSGTLLKRQNKLFRTCKRNQPLKKLILEGKVQCQRNRGRPNIL